MKKHKTLRHAIPALVKLMPLSEENCWDMFCFRDGKRMTEYVNCVINHEGEFKTGFFAKSDLGKKKINVRISSNSWTWRESKDIDRDKVFLCYFDILDVSHKRIFNIDTLNDCLDLIGTDKLTYFDKIESQGMDFTYERPYFVYYHQSKLKNRRLDIRKKYADVLNLNITIDELDNELFVAIQKMAIEKYGVIYGTTYSKGAIPCQVVEEIPVRLYDAKLWFSNRISFRIEHSHLRKTPFILMKAGGYHEDGLLNFHMKTIYEKAETVEEAEKFLKEFVSYSRIVPKLNSPWSFH